MTDPLFDSLFAALDADPGNIELRSQVARLLLERGRFAEALTHAGHVLQLSPGHAEALAVIAGSSAGLAAPTAADPATTPSAATDSPVSDAATADPAASSDAGYGAFDWRSAESDLGPGRIAPPFVADTPSADGTASADGSAGGPADPAFAMNRPGDGNTDPTIDVEKPTITLADVGGLEVVKRRLRESFLEPMKHPEIAQAFGKTLRGGLVLYGPPGCGKTFMAKAIAGELGANFLTVSISDILGTYVGETERNLHELFQKARSLAPAVLFLDELDAIGGKRSSIGTGWSGMRAMVDQLLMEMDSMVADNDGLFVLGATNTPWDVDAALLRPGRFDRLMLVLPPDEPAREAILRHHFERRPIAGIQLGSIVARTDGFSGADLEHVVSSAAEQAMGRSIASGTIEPIEMRDVDLVLTQVKASTGPWLVGAKNVAAFANTDGRYDDLVEFLKQKRIL